MLTLKKAPQLWGLWTPYSQWCSFTILGHTVARFVCKHFLLEANLDVQDSNTRLSATETWPSALVRRLQSCCHRQALPDKRQHGSP